MAVAIFPLMWITPQTQGRATLRRALFPRRLEGSSDRAWVVRTGPRHAARIELRSPSAILARLGGWLVGRTADITFPPRLEPNGSNPGGGSMWNYLHERRRPDSNRGIKALQASALPLGYGAKKRGAARHE